MRITDLFESEDKSRKLVVDQNTYNTVRVGNTYNYKGGKIYIASKDGAHPSDPTGRTMLVTVVDVDDSPESQEAIRQKQIEQRQQYEENRKKRALERLAHAEQALKDGFETEAARKDAMSDLSNVYEYVIRDTAANSYDTPFNLSQIREKHYNMFSGENLELLKKLVHLRGEIKNAALVPKKRDLEKAAKQKAAQESVIAVATRPLKEEAMKWTEKKAKEFVAEIKKQLEKVNFDPFEIVPRIPDLTGNYMSIPRAERDAHNKKQTAADVRRSVYVQFLTKKDRYEFEWSQEAADRYVAYSIKQTADHYDSFVAKMNEKIPNASSAEFRWINDVWGHSELVVDTPEGKEVWKTQMIINRSKLGKFFNQWPSRRVK